MKKSLHLISIRLLITIILCSLSKGVSAQDSTTETWENHVQAPSNWNTNTYPNEISISSTEQLAWVAKMVNDDTETGSSGEKGFEGVTINLTADLDLGKYLWIPIGKDEGPVRNQVRAERKPFKGTFNGNDHNIEYMNISTTYMAGLFGMIENAKVSNIKLIHCQIEKTISTIPASTIFNLYAGGIAGLSTSSTIENCHVEGTLNYKGGKAVRMGGITGKNESENGTQAIIKDCSFDGVFDYNLELAPLDNITYGWVGGIAGTNNASKTDGTIINCHAKITAKVIQAAAGGITTSNRGVIKECSAAGSINVTFAGTTNSVGGIVSDNVMPLFSNPTYTIENCTSSCDIDLTCKVSKKIDLGDYGNYSNYTNYTSVGGIAGTHNKGGARNVPPITDCTTSGTISIKLATDQLEGTDLSGNLCMAGGIVGFCKGAIQNCKSSAKVSATTRIPNTGACAGGITGIFLSTAISNCVASGSITIEGAACYGGGIAGKSTNTIRNSFSTANIISKGNNNSIGGIAGCNTTFEFYSGDILDCYSTGNITSSGETNHVGGIAGYNQYVILNCYTTSNIVAICIQNTKANEDSRGYVGGITGINKGNSEKSKSSVVNCLALNTGGITYNATTPGRIVGYQDQTVATVTNNFAHKEIPIVDDAAVDNGADWDGSSYPFAASDAWNFTDNTQLPKLKKINDDGNYSEMVANQPNIPLHTLQSFTITFDTPDNGTLTVNQENNTPISSGDKVLGGTKLTITAEASEGYQVNKLLVNSTPFTSGDVLTVSSDITIAVTITKKPEPTPDPDPDPTPKPDPDPTPTVYHIVTLPQIEGATTDPVAGEYEVESWSSFRFYLTLDEAYSQSSPIVTTDRSETITPRSSDGAYIIKYVRQPIAISIDGIIKNPDPVANEKIDANSPKVWTKDSYLHLQTPQPETVFIYTFNGTLLKKLTNLSGNKTLWLPQGNYIVLIGKERFKVQVK